MELKNLNLSGLILVPVLFGLIFTMLINGGVLLMGGDQEIAMFMNYYNKVARESFPSFAPIALKLNALLQLLTGAFLLIALVRRELFVEGKAKFLRLGLVTALFSVAIYGFAVRMISNHQAAANLFYYTGLLYMLLWYVETHLEKRAGDIVDKLKLLPLMLTMLYTMGQPGLQKLINTEEVLPNYVAMFSDTFLARLPGGIPPFIYMLGLFELLVAILVLLSIAKLEFLPGRTKTFLSSSLAIGALTFIMLAFGLSILLAYPGATNLIFYAVFCIGFYYYAQEQRA